MQKSFSKVCNTRDIKRYLHVSKNKNCLRGVTQISFDKKKLTHMWTLNYASAFYRNSGSTSFVIVKNAKSIM